MHTRPFLLALLLAGVAMFSSSCATLLHDNHQSVRIFSEPGEAKVTVDGLFHLTTVGTVNLSRLTDHIAVIEKDGYEPTTVKIERHMSGWVWWNLFCTIFVYSCVKSDREDGGYWAFDDNIYVELTKRADAAPPRPQAQPPAP